jgi:uncharacterized protein (UPF0333 family)
MNKKMDTNFAFAILLLVAAIVGMYFWLNNANEEVADIYPDDQNMVIERNNKAEDMVEDDTEVMDESDVSDIIE